MSKARELLKKFNEGFVGLTQSRGESLNWALDIYLRRTSGGLGSLKKEVI